MGKKGKGRPCMRPLPCWQGHGGKAPPGVPDAPGRAVGSELVERRHHQMGAVEIKLRLGELESDFDMVLFGMDAS
ncbi:hypothetical protein AA0243_2807 [Novacetimonas hansenii NRIC 0243]|nr:hypothetical protein AA0243_2807 [Novacetimonas hansenii NRIC 0243]